MSGKGSPGVNQVCYLTSLDGPAIGLFMTQVIYNPFADDEYIGPPVFYFGDTFVWFHIPIPILRYRDSHSKDKTIRGSHYKDTVVATPSYLYKGNSPTWQNLYIVKLHRKCFALVPRKYYLSRYWPFVKGIHRWPPVDSHHKGPVMRKASPCHEPDPALDCNLWLSWLWFIAHDLI